MIRNATIGDLPALRALFARANDAPYDLPAVAEEKCFGHGYSGEPVVRVYGDMQGAAVTCGKFLRILAVDRDARRRKIGSALLADAESRGTSVIAAEPGNYLTPGVLATDQGAIAFLRKHGYVDVAETHNLDVSLAGLSPSPRFPAARETGGSERNEEGLTLRRATHADAGRVLSFIEEHFGRIWRFESAKAFDREEPTLFISEERATITGFAAHDVNNRGLGFFGPTGVAKSMRGRGLGCALLLASLDDLQRLGHRRAVIPWTDAFEFYRRCSGAEAAHRFIAFGKPQK